MTSHRPRLLVPTDALPRHSGLIDTLRSAFDVVEVESVDPAGANLDAGYALLPVEAIGGPEGASLTPIITLLDRIGEGLGIVDVAGRFKWSNASLRSCDETVRSALLDITQRTIDRLEARAADAGDGELIGRFRTVTFNVGDAVYETTISVASVIDGRIGAVACTLQEITAHERIRSTIDAIDSAGEELLRFDTDAIMDLDMADRLRLLEERITRSAKDLLNFDHFEIRLIDRETNRLELVFAIGIAPLRIGEVMHAEAEGNGISGYVAATGESYLCHDVMRDPRYTEGLPDAASALTVPLRLHEQVIGVFNVESRTPAAFGENDRRFAEIFGRYVAMAMHVLDLLVVERYTTNERISDDVLGEIKMPLQRIREEADAVAAVDEAAGQRLRAAVDQIEQRLQACADGPRSLLGAEQALHEREPEPSLRGKRIIVADNEEGVRDGICDLLRHHGCIVTSCAGGAETIEALRNAETRKERFHLVISDIRMPDRNGYEVFRTAKALSPDTGVILMTGFGYDPHHAIVRATQEGLDAFLFKPLKASSLIDNVVKAVGKHGA